MRARGIPLDRRLAGLAAGALVLAGMGGLDVSGARAAAAPRVVITADTLSLDAASGIAAAAGRVRISDGTVTATAARAVLYHRDGRSVLTGGARVEGPQGTLQAEEITVRFTPRAITRIAARGQVTLEAEGTRLRARGVVISPSEETVRAEEAVATHVHSGVVANAAVLTYDRRRGLLVLEGLARLQHREGAVQAGRMEGFRREGRAVLSGDVHAVYRDVEVRSRAAEWFAGEQRAVFADQVLLTQPGRRLATEKVTVWYGTGRIVAEGLTSVRLEGQP